MATNAKKKGHARRDELLEISAELFAEHGVKSTTTRDIANRADMLSGSLYYHFSSKEAIVTELIERYWTALFERHNHIVAQSSTPVERLSALVAASLEVAMIHRNELLILHQDWHYLKVSLPGLDQRMDRVGDDWIGTIKAGVDSGDFRADLSPALTYRSIVGALNWVVRWFSPQGEMALAEIAKVQTDLFLSGMLVDEPPS